MIQKILLITILFTLNYCSDLTVFSKDKDGLILALELRQLSHILEPPKDSGVLTKANSAVFDVATIKQMPTIPTNLSVNQTSNSITLNWKASTYENGKIKSYEVSKDNGISWIDVGNVLSYTFSNLKQGSVYHLKVKAKNDKNAHSRVASTTIKLGNALPSIPTSLLITQNSTNVTLTWTASTDSDGSIISYEVSKDNGGIWQDSGSDLTHTFTNLITGRTYNFQVRAKDNENTYGNAATASMKLGNIAPSSPTNLVTTQTSNSITLTWTASTDNGSISDYEVSIDNGTNWISSGTDLTHTFNGLTTGTTYVLKVRAKDNENTYSNAATLSIRLGNTAPSSPTNLATTQTSNSITLTWTASTDDGSISDYEVSINNGTNWISSGTDLTHTFNSLAIGTTYTLQVRAKDNENIYGAASQTRLKLGNLLPSVPTSLTAVQNLRSITLTWAASSDTDGSITDYEVSNNGTNWISSGTDLTHTFNGLAIGTTYTLQVRAKDNENAYSTSASTSKSIQDVAEIITLGKRSTFIKKLGGRVYAFGLNDEGQLGLGDTTNRLSLTELTVAPADATANKPIIRGQVKNIAAGDRHTFIQTNDGKLFVFGRNDEGQLGLGDNNDRNKPTELTVATATASKPILRGQVKNIHLNLNHSFIETNDGKLFVFGDNISGELGLGDLNNRNKPTELTVATATASKPIVRNQIKNINLGYSHSFIETNDGKLFVFGSDGYGQLGINTYGSEHTPIELTVATATASKPILRNQIKKVALGGTFSFIQTNDNKLFVFGMNTHGELGLGNTTNRSIPTELTVSTATVSKPILRNQLKAAALGGFHSFVQTKDGKVFSFGRNNYGQLGLGNNSNQNSPVELTTSSTNAIKPIARNTVRRIFAGRYHSFLETNDNKIFVFGRNNNGQLGLGSTTDKNVPTELTLP